MGNREKVLRATQSTILWCEKNVGLPVLQESSARHEVREDIYEEQGKIWAIGENYDKQNVINICL